VFNASGDVEQGIFKDNKLFDGIKWAINDSGSYDFFVFNQGEGLLKKKGV
jgi:hypothetical protein